MDFTVHKIEWLSKKVFKNLRYFFKGLESIFLSEKKATVQKI